MAVIVAGANIADVVPTAQLPSTMSVRAMPAGAWLAAGFIDLQVNGGGDVLFNDQPTADCVRAIAAAHRKFGTTALLPTLISDSPEKTLLALTTINDLVGPEPAVLGLHLEGPFLSREKPGVHDPRYIRSPDAADLAMLTAPRDGALLVTLAPEVVPRGFISRLVSAGVRVSLGHSMATYGQTCAAMAEGLTGFTHFVQCGAAIVEPGTRANRASAGIERGLLRHHRRRLPCRSGHATAGLARARQTYAGERRNAAARRKPLELQPQRTKGRGATGPLRHRGRNLGRNRAWHGDR